MDNSINTVVLDNENQIDFSNGIMVQEYFDGILKSVHAEKVVSVFSKCPSFSNHGCFREYMADSEIYILFESGKCIIIFYPFIDSLNVEFRLLSDDEVSWYKDLTLKDYFNNCTDVYISKAEEELHLWKNQKISLEYDSIVSVSLKSVTGSYSKWVGESLIEEISPNATTFERMTFKMANGNSFVICPADAMFDGYTMVWSEDTQEVISEF